MPFDIREHLEKLTPSKRKGFYHCPVCDSKNFGIQAPTGAYRCHTNQCDNADIRNAIAPIEDGEQPKAKKVLPPKPKAKPVIIRDASEIELGSLPGDRTYATKQKRGGKTFTYYPYGNGHKVERIDSTEGKTILPKFTPQPDNPGRAWETGKGDRPWDAYRIDEALKFAAGEFVVVVEGEKCVEAMRWLGVPSITFNGSGWTDKDFSRAIAKLKGTVKGLLIIPDNDAPGRKKAQQLLEACASHSYPALIVEPLHLEKDLDDGGDVADWIIAARRIKDDKESMMLDLFRAISRAVEAQYPDEPEPQPVVAETTKPLTPHRPETRRIHGGYKDLKVVELNDFVDDVLGDRLSFDNLLCEVLVDGKPFKFGQDIKFWFFNEFGESASANDIYACMLYKAKLKEFNPVQRYLERVHKEAAPVSIDDIATRYFGTDNPFYDRMVKMWLISAVARVYEPGCQVDHTLILQSNQGKYKSTWFKTLSDPWFSDSIKDLTHKDSLMILHSNWIVELAELDRITSKKKAGEVKHFLTQRQDHMRKPYDKEIERCNRRAVFCGTVNPSNFLVDEENRRFWIIPLSNQITGEIIDRLRVERDGIWASATAAYLNGEKWYPSDEEKRAIAELTKEFEEEDVWTGSVAAFLEQRNTTTVYDVMLNALEFEPSKMFKKEETRVTKILKKLGWEKTKRKRVAGKYVRLWGRPSDASTTNTNNNLNIGVEVGHMVKGAEPIGLQVNQPLNQPAKGLVQTEVGHEPTPVIEVGASEKQSQQGMNHVTNLDQGIPETYINRGYKYQVGTLVQCVHTDVVYEINDYAPIGPRVMNREYECIPVGGGEAEWVRQRDLIPC